MERNLCLLALFCFNLYGADFIYSAQISTLNHVVTYQNLSISPVMEQKKRKNLIYTCTIEHKKDKNISEYEYLKKYKDELFECFLGESVKVYENSLFNLAQANANTQLFFNPIRFKARFSQRNCKIYTFN